MDKKPVLLIDLSAIFRAAYHANADGPLSVAFEATIGGVNRALGMAHMTGMGTVREENLIAICCDGRGNWRKELSPEYKAHREKQPESMYGLFDRIKARLKADGHLLWTVDGFEADDIIATACDAAVASGHPVTIASHDKDLLQLLKPTVKFLKTSTWELFDDTTGLAKFGVKPSQLGDWLALVGDKSDGVAGVDGIGAVKATDLLVAYGTLDKVFEAAKSTDNLFSPFWKSRKAVRAALIEHEATARLARKLVELRYDVPIRFEEIFEERKIERITEGNIDMDEAPEITSGKITGTPDTSMYVQQQGRGGSDGISIAEFVPIDIKQKTDAPIQQASVSLVPFERGLEPTSPGGAQLMAKVLQESRLYPKLLNEAQIFAVIARGREVGLGALVSLDVFEIVEGRLCMKAHAIIAKVMEDPNCEYFHMIETTPTQATYETKHRKNPGPTRLTYTVEQAKIAGLVKPGGAWEKNSGPMCRKTAGVQLGRIVFPAAALGLYAPEEFGGES